MKNYVKKRSFPPRVFAFILMLVILTSIIISCYEPYELPEAETEPNLYWYIAEENDYTPAEWQDVLEVLEQLSQLGITRPERFKTLSDAKYIIEHRLKLINKTISADNPIIQPRLPVKPAV